MKVFITGATGYIGFNVAQAFRRAGHEVWGLTRSKEKSTLLAEQEIHPVTGDMQKPDSYRSIAEECQVLIHAAFDYQDDSVALDRKTVETFLECGNRGTQPKTVIYTSGVWVHGNTGGKLVDETTSLNPPKIVAWRPAVENMVLGAPGIKGLVIRPGCVYGKRGGLTGMWFDAAYNQKTLRPVGDGNNRWTMVHADDLADAYMRVAESGLSGEVFNITDRSRWSVREMVEAVARVTGYEGEIKFLPLEEAKKNIGDFAEALALDQHVDGRKAVRLLDWQPKHGGFVDNVDIYFEAWKAHQT